MVKEIINWCNSNNGFATILLSALTLLVSIIAIIVSIHAARLPYKKKLIVSGGSFVSVGGIGLHITATNVGWGISWKMEKSGTKPRYPFPSPFIISKYSFHTGTSG